MAEVEMIDTRMVEQRQVFTIRIFSNSGNWTDIEATSAADAIVKNDAAIAAKEAGLIRTYQVRSQWVGIASSMEDDITQHLKLSER